MLSITSNPELFQGVLKSGLLLKQPEPQYLFANLLYLASSKAELKGMPANFGISPDRAASGGGAPVPNFEDFQLRILDDPRSDAILVDNSLSEEPLSGNGIVAQVTSLKAKSLQLARPRFTAGTYTMVSRVVNPAVDISTTPIELANELATITLQPYAGPHDGTSVKPFAINALDAPSGILDLGELDRMHMQRDRTKLLDTALATLFANGANTIYPLDPANAVSSANSAFPAGAQGNRPMDMETIYRMQQKLRDLGIPTFANGCWVFVLSTQAARQLSTDPDFLRQRVFDPTINPLLAQNYVGRVENMELYVCSTIPTGTANSTITYYKNMAFGPGAVGYAPGLPPHIRFTTSDNYGLSPKAIWLAVEGFDVLDNRFLVNCYSN